MENEVMKIEELALEAQRMSSLGAAIADAMEFTHNDRKMYTPAIEALQEMLYNHHMKLKMAANYYDELGVRA